MRYKIHFCYTFVTYPNKYICFFLFGAKHRTLLTDINNREVYMKGIDASYHYEGYNIYKAQDLK